MLKAQDPDVVTVFIGPCMAKKSEAADKTIENNADYVLTYGECIELMRAKGVELEPEELKNHQASAAAKRFANGGGVTAAVLQHLKEEGIEADVKVAKVSGGAERFAQHFVEVDGHKLCPIVKYYRMPREIMENSRQQICFE